MHIEKLVVKNFKRFRNFEFDFNSDTNIIVGDNESGKSSLLEAIEICLNFTFHGRPLAGELSTEFFNTEAVTEFLKFNMRDRTFDKLPRILIEAYLSGAPGGLCGRNNSKNENTTGVFVEIKMNPDFKLEYSKLQVAKKIESIPIEFYLLEWYSFAWKKINRYSKPTKNLFIEPDRIHPTLGKNKYINNILNENLDESTRSKLNLAFRQVKSNFDKNDDVVSVNKIIGAKHQITEKDLKLTTEIKSNATWENNLQLAVDEIPFAHIGKGEQSQIQVKLSLQNLAHPVEIVLIEELENHLSHLNLVKLIDYVEQYHQGKQLFITTHSSFVLNKLSIGKLCLIGEKYKRIKDLEPETINKIKRLPEFNTLRVVLAKKVILVEGPSDELIIKRLFKDECGKLPEKMGIDVIVVGGLRFKPYLNIAKSVGTFTIVIKDNDGDYKTKIQNWFEDYKDSDNLKILAPVDDTIRSLEPALIRANSKNLSHFASIVLPESLYKKFEDLKTSEEKEKFLVNFYKDDRGRKVDSSLEIFESDEKIEYPEFLRKVIDLVK